MNSSNSSASFSHHQIRLDNHPIPGANQSINQSPSHHNHLLHQQRRQLQHLQIMQENLQHQQQRRMNPFLQQQQQQQFPQHLQQQRPQEISPLRFPTTTTNFVGNRSSIKNLPFYNQHPHHQMQQPPPPPPSLPGGEHPFGPASGLPRDFRPPPYATNPGASAAPAFPGAAFSHPPPPYPAIVQPPSSLPRSSGHRASLPQTQNNNNNNNVAPGPSRGQNRLPFSNPYPSGPSTTDVSNSSSFPRQQLLQQQQLQQQMQQQQQQAGLGPVFMHQQQPLDPKTHGTGRSCQTNQVLDAGLYIVQHSIFKEVQ